MQELRSLLGGRMMEDRPPLPETSVMTFSCFSDLERKEPSWAAAYEAALVEEHGSRRRDLQPREATYMIAI